MEAQSVDVNEWNRASKGMKLPEKVKSKKNHEAVAKALQHIAKR